MKTSNQINKKKLAADVYLSALVFFWINSDIETKDGRRCKSVFDDYADILCEIGDRFEGNDFSSLEDQTFIVDDLDMLYYAIVEINPASDTLCLMRPAIDMLDDVEASACTCRH